MTFLQILGTLMLVAICLSILCTLGIFALESLYEEKPYGWILMTGYLLLLIVLISYGIYKIQ